MTNEQKDVSDEKPPLLEEAPKKENKNKNDKNEKKKKKVKITLNY